MSERATGLTQAAQVVRAAGAARAAGHAALDWALLEAWPTWALDAADPARRRHWLRLGAAWHAPALRQCIDGECLQAAEDLVGHAVLAAIVERDAPDGVATLPASVELSAQWLRCGQSLAVAALRPATLRAAVRDAVGAEASQIDAATAAALIAWVETLPVDEALTT